jgi:MFS family permease
VRHLREDRPVREGRRRQGEDLHGLRDDDREALVPRRRHILLPSLPEVVGLQSLSFSEGGDPYDPATPAPGRLTGPSSRARSSRRSGFLFGFDTAVISGTTEALQRVYGLGGFALGFTVASALIGTIVGSLVAGRPADVYGRRAALLAIAVLYFVSAVGCALAWSWASLLFFRFVGGIGIGGASVVSPMYVAETSSRLRGRLVAVTQLNIVLGILVAFFSNYWIAGLGLGQDEWRWMLGVVAIPAAAFFLLLFLTPQSPRWLAAHGRADEAAAVLARLGATRRW